MNTSIDNPLNFSTRANSKKMKLEKLPKKNNFDTCIFYTNWISSDFSF